MRHTLYSELRTLYEATADNPRTFRVTMKMKDMIDEAILVNAVRKSMERYPYYRVRLGMDEREVFFLDNPMPVPVLHTDGPIMLGGYETQGHVLAFCWWKNKVHIDLIHALTVEGEDYLTAFIEQLRENDINYDVLYQEPTKYPGFISPWL